MWQDERHTRRVSRSQYNTYCETNKEYEFRTWVNAVVLYSLNGVAGESGFFLFLEWLDMSQYNIYSETKNKEEK